MVSEICLWLRSAVRRETGCAVPWLALGMLAAGTTTVCGTGWLWCCVFRLWATSPMSAINKAPLVVIMAASTVSLIFSVREVLLWPNILVGHTACTTSCTIVFCKPTCYHAPMKSDLRISIKDYNRNKNLKIQLQRAIFSHRQFYVHEWHTLAQGWPPCFAHQIAHQHSQSPGQSRLNVSC